ncbi:MAG: hypothetical protein IIX72_00685 [Oscillospiraceae bacterium]|nr:hypothetical protein [Oscillospiraceae bacterium]
MEAELLSAVKYDLGIKSSAKDSDIEENIDAAIEDISRHGVADSKISRENPSIRQAVKLYCRAVYNFQGDGERYAQSYEKYVNGLALDGKFKEAKK